jgi:hypothetical protein
VSFATLVPRRVQRPRRLRPNNVYAYPKVGFFDDDTLATKASATVIAGTSDTTHEKLVLAPGTRVVYLNDPAGVTWRLGITYVAGATSATINVSKKN